VLRRLTRDQQQAKHIEVEMLVEMLRRDGLERGELVDTRVVDEDIDRTERLHRLRDDVLHVLRLGQIAMNRDGFAPLGGDGGDHPVGGLLARAVIDGNRRALGRKPGGDFGTYAFGCACYQRNLAFESLGHCISSIDRRDADIQ
jgi:hypothetical protein